MHLGIYELLEFILGFHNDGANNWPSYDKGKTEQQRPCHLTVVNLNP